MTPQDELERIVDLAGLKNTMTMLATICGDKAEHIAVNWQDSHSAKDWDKMARAIDSAIVKIWGRL
jgi:hypothetical protein